MNNLVFNVWQSKIKDMRSVLYHFVKKKWLVDYYFTFERIP